MKTHILPLRPFFVGVSLFLLISVVGCESATKEEKPKAATQTASASKAPAPATKIEPVPKAVADAAAKANAQPPAAEPAAAGQNVIEKFQALGGKLNKAGNQAAKKSDPDSAIVSVQLSQKLASPDDLALLPAFTQLESLDLRGTGIGDSALAHVGKLKSLKTLKVGGSAVTDAGMDHLAGLVELSHLNLIGSAVTGNGLAKLHPLAKLKYLDLDATQVNDAGLAELGAFKNLEEVHLGRQPAQKEVEGSKEKVYFDRDILITDAGLKELKNLPSLTVVYLYGGGITDAGLVELESVPQLKRLVLAGTFATDAGVEDLQQKLQKCKISLENKRVRTDAKP